MESIFINTSIILSIAIVIAFIVQIMRQPLIISYIVTGIICGPLFLGITDASYEFFEILSELGVILLLFLVGLSLNLEHLKKIGKVSVITGLGQVIFTSLIGLALLLVIGFNLSSAVYLSIAITFSSTIVIMKLLSDKKELRTVYGRYTMGLMIVQDIIAISIMIIMPVFSSDESFSLAILTIFLKFIFIIAIVYFLSKILLPIILKQAAKSSEFLLIFTLAWCFSISGLGAWIGLSLEIGAIIAGLSLGSSIYKDEISSRIKPLRDFFIVLFFIILGSEMNVDNFWSAVWPSFILSIFILVGNPLILYYLYRICKFTRKDSLLAGLTAAQVSEFGFVFLFVAQQNGFIDNQVLSIFTIVALSTIFVSSYLITYNYQIFNFLKPILDKFGKDRYKEKKIKNENFEVLVFGYHRLGWKICEALTAKKKSFAVIDCDPTAINKLIRRKIPHFFGEAGDIDFLQDLPIENTKMIISTLPNAVDQLALVHYIKSIDEKKIIISSLSHINFLDDLYRAGVDYVLVPHLISGQWISEILQEKQWSKKTFLNLKNKQKNEMQLKYNLE